MVISGKGVAVSYAKSSRKNINNRVYILNSTEIDITSGEVTFILGRSGSGKTTLLSVLAGLLQPTEGRVLYDDTDIYKESDESFSLFRNKNIGFIPQGQSLIQTLTVRENILLQTGSLKKDSELSQRADELIDALGLSDRADYYPKELSGGEIRRCAIARALINDPKVIFADEPTGDLDDSNTEIVFELLRKKAREGCAVVIVTHEESAIKYADVVFRMDAGTLKQAA